ncbi:MAG TPA: hypothetical protein VI998_04225 [Patescibacteria group bacterium]|nr:hypothetical protein [Patescibacteria group bacterium]
MAEEKDDKNKKENKKEKESQVVTLTLMAGQVKNRQAPVTAFVSLGKKELAGKNVYFYIGQNYQPAGESATGTDGRAGALIDIPVDAKGSTLISAKADGMEYPKVSIIVDIPEEEKKQVAQVKFLHIEATWQGYDDEGNSKYQWIPRLFDADRKSISGSITISTESPIRLNDGISTEEKTLFVKEIPEKEIKVYRLIISGKGLVEVDVFVHGCDTRREFHLRGKKEVVTAGEAPQQNAGWWKKFKYGLKGGKL